MPHTQNHPPLFQATLDPDALKLRNDALMAARILEHAPVEALRQLLDIARLITRAELAFVNRVDDHIVANIVASRGALNQHQPQDSFCAVLMKEPARQLVVLDASQDPRFARLPVVTGDEHVRFYAGTAVLSPEGIPVGTLCVMDRTPREDFPDELREGLATLAMAVTARLELRQQVIALEDERKKFTAFMDSGPLVAFMKDEQGRYSYVNQQFLDSFGLKESELIGKRDADLWPADIASALEAHDRWVLTQGQPVELTEAGPADEDGNGTWWQSHKFVVPGQRRLLGGIALNVTELHRMQSKFRHLAGTDALTGLPNRHALNEVLLEIGEQRSGAGDLTAVMFMDLDHFKQVNDQHGHQAGDMLLVEFADRLRRSVRSTDKIFRLAGDEFVVVLDKLRDKAEAVKVADKIITAMQAPIKLNGQTCQASTSIGIAVRPTGEVDSAALLAMADDALYQAKHAGRGGYSIAA